MDNAITEKVEKWLTGGYDEATKAAVKELQEGDEKTLQEAFYKNLEFGTGGLRGIMGVGSNRVNKYTIGMATQGFANYLNQSFAAPISVAIAYDCRNNSKALANITANVFAANNIKVYLFEDLRPTPELSFAIRHLGCQGGVVLTASHNPKEYNGYKAYWDDGAQLVPPHDKNVITEVEKITDVKDVKWSGGEKNIEIIGEQIDQAYLDMIKGLSIYPEIIKEQGDLKIVYTPIHGTGIKLVPLALEAFGFTNVTVVNEQSTPNGNFPTVEYPNPEERETMSIGLAKAKELDADILLGTDPDADRVGVGVKNNKGEWILLNGNQTAMMAFTYMIEARKNKGVANENDMVVKTIVTTSMIDKVAEANDIKCYNVLTGFKWISSLIKEKEGKENYVVGGEESFGLMIGNEVRDKDAISAVALICEMAAVEKSKGKTLYDKLMELSVQYGLYLEDLISITKKGMDGAQQIADMMEESRNNPPKEIAGVKVKQLLDYEKQDGKNLIDNTSFKIELPKSNVLQYILEDDTVISARPSGTEPKIKYYFSVNKSIADISEFDNGLKELEEKITAIQNELGLTK